MEGVDVLEHRALGEQHQVGVAARADGRVGAQAAVGGEVLAGGEELPFILRPRLGVATLPGGVELEEGELGKGAIAIAAMLALRSLARLVPPVGRGGAGRLRGVVIAVLPYGTTVERDRAVPELAPGRDQRRARRGARRRRPSSTSARATGSTRTSTTATCRVSTSATAASRGDSGSATVDARRERAGEHRPGPARLDPGGRRDPGRRRGRQRPRDPDRGRPRRRGRGSPTGRACAARLRAGPQPGPRPARASCPRSSAALGADDLLIAIAAGAARRAGSCCRSGSPARASTAT